MGQLVSSTLPNLIGGVSQQPYSVRLPTQCEEQTNCLASLTDFLRRRPATHHIARIMDNTAGGIDDAAIHTINRDERERYIVIVINGVLRVFSLDGQEKTVVNTAADYLDTQKPSQDLRFLTINDYTFVLNRSRTVHMQPALSPKRPPEALFFIKQASYNTTYTLILDGQRFAHTTQDGVAPAGSPPDTISSAEILNSIASAVQAALPHFTISVSGAAMWIRRNDGVDFEIKAEDTRSNTHTSVCKDRVQTFSDLLTTAPAGYVVEVVGDAGSNFDNYYVKFVCNNASAAFDDGMWVETVKPGIPCKLDATTMPHTLVRNADGTFTFAAAEWGERTCGDEDNAPDPSFVGRNISGLLFYRNRLSFLSWDNLVMSRVGEFFDFFVTTVTTMLDNDPIDTAASHPRPTNLEHTASYSGGLLLFSSSTQFVLEHDSVLSNATASIRPVTEFEADTLAAPVSAGKTVFFSTRKGEFSGIREYYTLPDNSDQNDAADVTAHVPHYIRGRVSSLVCSTNEDILFVQTRKDKEKVYVYKYFWNGQEKSQSCWSTWVFGGKVLALACVDTVLYLVVLYPDDGVYVEKAHIEPGYTDADASFEYCLDRKLKETAVLDAVPNIVEKTTTLTLPYPVNEGITVVRRKSDAEGGFPEGRVLEVLATSGNTVTVRGLLDVTADGKVTSPLFLGMPYESLYKFTRLTLRERGANGMAGSAIADGRLQLRRLTISVAATGYLEVTVFPDFRAPSTRIFTGRETGHGTNRIGSIPLYTGVVAVPVLSRNTQADIVARSTSHLPFALVNATWEGFFNARSVRR